MLGLLVKSPTVSQVSVHTHTPLHTPSMLTLTHTHTPVHTHTPIHTHSYTCSLSHSHSDSHSLSRTLMPLHIHTHSYTHHHTLPLTHTHSLSSTLTLLQTHPHTHSHVQLRNCPSQPGVPGTQEGSRASCGTHALSGFTGQWETLGPAPHTARKQTSQYKVKPPSGFPLRWTVGLTQSSRRLRVQRHYM